MLDIKKETTNKYQLLTKLADITAKEILLIENLSNMIKESATKNPVLSALASHSTLIANYKKTQTLIAKHLPAAKETFNQERIKQLGQIHLQLDLLRKDTEKICREFVQKLIEIIAKNLKDTKVVTAKRKVKAAVDQQVRAGTPLSQLVTYLNYKKLLKLNFKSLTIRLQKILEQYAKVQEEVNAVLQQDSIDHDQIMFNHELALASITLKYSETLSLVHETEPETYLTHLYKAVPWFNSSEDIRKQKLSKVVNEKTKWVHELNDTSTKNITQLHKILDKQHSAILEYDDFRLHESYHSTEKHSSLGHITPGAVKWGNKIFGTQYSFYKNEYIYPFEQLLERFNSTSDEEETSRIVSEIILFLKNTPSHVRLHLTQFIGLEYGGVIQTLLVRYPSVIYVKLYGSDKKESTNPLAEKIYQLLRTYLDPKTPSQLDQVRPIINKVWKVFFALKQGENHHHLVTQLASEINVFLKEIKKIPDFPTWQFIESIAELFFASDFKLQLQKANLYWTLPPDITFKIMSTLNVKDVLNIGQSCRYLNKLANDDVIWQPFYRTSYNQSSVTKAKSAFSNQGKLKLVNDYFSLIKKTFLSIACSEQQKNNLHLHDLTFKSLDDKIVSEQILNEHTVSESFKKEVSYCRRPVQTALVQTKGGLHVIVTYIEGKETKNAIRQLANNLHSQENNCKTLRRI